MQDLLEIGFILNLADQFSPKIGVAGQQLSKFEQNVIKVQRLSSQAMGAGMAASMVGSAFLEPIGNAIDKTAQFQHAIVGVQKTTGLGGESIKIFEGGAGEIGQLSDAIMEMGRTIPVSHAELAGIAETAGQLGIEGVDNITQFTDVAARMASVSDLSAESASQSFASLTNVFKLDIGKDLEGLGSIINELSNTSGASAAYITDAMNRIGKATDSVQVHQVAGIAATLKDMGIGAEIGGTAISQAFAKMQTESDKFADRLGINETTWQLKVQDDTIGAFKDVLNLVQTADQTQKTSIIKDLFGGEAGMLNTIQKLSGSQDKLNEHLKTAADQFKEQTSLQTEFQASQDSLINQQKLLSNVQDELIMNLAGMFMPALMRVTTLLRDMTIGILEWAKENPNLAKTIMWIVGGLGGFLLVGGVVLGTIGAIGLAFSSGIGALAGFGAGISKLIKAYRAWSLVTTLTTAKQWLLNTAFWASPITWVVAGIAALTAGVVAIIYYWDELSAYLRDTPFAFVVEGIEWIADKLRMFGLLDEVASVETAVTSKETKQITETFKQEELGQDVQKATSKIKQQASAPALSGFQAQQKISAKQAFEINVSAPLEMNFYGRNKEEVDREFEGIKSKFTLDMEDALQEVLAKILRRQGYEEHLKTSSTN